MIITKHFRTVSVENIIFLAFIDYTVGVKIKFPLRVRSTYVERRNVITIVQRYAKSTVLPLGYYTHQLVFIIPQTVAIGFRT